MQTSTCLECGSAPVNHRTEFLGNWVDHWVNRYFAPLEYVRQSIQPAISLVPWYLLTRPLLWLGTTTRIITVQDSLLATDNSRTIALWNSAQLRHINIQRILLFGHATEFSVARFGGRTVGYMSMPRPVGKTSNAYYWMDNKSTMQKKFSAVGIPVPQTFECRNEKEALEAFHTIKQTNDRVIIKPTYGSRSRHTTMGIVTDGDLKRAFHIAYQISPRVIVQEELPGMVHRVLWVGNKIIAVMRREPAYVRGDGRRSIKDLVAAENQNPLRHGPIFHELPTDAPATRELERQNYTWESVPDTGTVVIINPKVSRGNGAVNVDVTSSVHPKNMELFTKIGSFVNDPIVGVDFIIRDIDKPWTEQLPCGVIECNALPYVDLHSSPFAGSTIDAAGAVWEIVFPDSRITSSETGSIQS